MDELPHIERARRCCAALGVRATLHGGRASTGSTTPRESWSGSAASRRSWRTARVPRAVHLRANRCAEPHRHRALSRLDPRSGERSGAHQPRGSRRASGSPSYCSSGSIATRKSCRYYRAADFCLVTSLHDGMNLVAKEFVAARDDEHGVLILSRFTGACHELTDCAARQSLRHGRNRRVDPPCARDAAA